MWHLIPLCRTDAPNPTFVDVRLCSPIFSAQERLCALILDVAKTHRRIRIRSCDQGLLCFRHRGKLYLSSCLNFGARASSFYWSRMAGLLVRFTRKLWFVSHSGFIYVDDLLALLESTTARPLWSGILVVLLILRGAALTARCVDWLELRLLPPTGLCGIREAGARSPAHQIPVEVPLLLCHGSRAHHRGVALDLRSFPGAPANSHPAVRGSASPFPGYVCSDTGPVVASPAQGLPRPHHSGLPGHCLRCSALTSWSDVDLFSL